MCIFLLPHNSIFNIWGSYHVPLFIYLGTAIIFPVLLFLIPSSVFHMPLNLSPPVAELARCLPILFPLIWSHGNIPFPNLPRCRLVSWHWVLAKKTRAKCTRATSTSGPMSCESLLSLFHSLACLMQRIQWMISRIRRCQRQKLESLNHYIEVYLLNTCQTVTRVGNKPLLY